MRTRCFLVFVPLITFFSCPMLMAGPPLPNPAVFSNVTAAISTNQINWICVKGTNTNRGSSVISYKFAGESNRNWLTSRTNRVTGLFKNTQYFEKVMMRSNVTGPSNQWSTNYLNYRYTLVPPPGDLYLSVTPVDFNRMTVSIITCHNAFSNQTGCKFTNMIARGPGGTNSLPLTNVYVFTNTNLFLNTCYGYKVKYKNGNGIWTIFNPTIVSNYTLLQTPSSNNLTVSPVNWSKMAVTVLTCHNAFIGQTGSRFSNVINADVSPALTGLYVFTNTNLRPNTEYGYKVKYKNASGVWTPFCQGAIENYTLLQTPSSNNLTVSPVDWDKMAVTVLTCHNAFIGQTGSRFSNVINADVSPALTGLYVFTNTNLRPNTKYGYKAKYKNANGVWTLFNQGIISNFTFAAVPYMESVVGNYNILSNYFTRVFINSNGNPSFTFYAIYCTNTHNWLNGSGRTTSSTTWQTRASWLSNRNYHTNLNANTYYGYQVMARNRNNILTALSVPLADLTPPAAPASVTVAEMNDDYFSITWPSVPSAVDYSVYILTNRRNISRSDYIFLAFRSLTSYSDNRNGGAPVAPAGVKVTNTSATDTSRLRVAWNPVASFLAASNFFYSVRARNSSGKQGAYSPASTSGDTNITPVIKGYRWFRGSTSSNFMVNTVFTDTGLSANRRYDYQVKAYSSDGLEGARSSWASNCTAIQTPSFIVFSTITSNSILVSANGSYSNLTRKSSGLYFSNVTNISNSAWVQVNNWNSTGLLQNKPYGFKVKARNAESLETPECPVSSKFTYCRVPASPVILTNTLFTNAMMVSLRTNRNPWYTEYAVSNLTAGGFVQPNGTINPLPAWQTFTQWRGLAGITNKGLLPSVNYTYTVRARNNDGISTVSSMTSLWRFTLARVPSGLRPGIWSTTNIPFEWHNEGAVYFGIESALDSGGFPGTFIYLKNYNDKYTMTNFNHTGLYPDTKYWYRVKAYNGNGKATLTCAPIFVITTVTPPPPPTNFNGLSSATNKILWQWDNRPSSARYFFVASTNGTFVSGPLPYPSFSFLETNLVPNTFYKRYAVASNASGMSGASRTNQVCTLSTIPVHLMASLFSEDAAACTVSLEWSSSRASSFDVERALSVNEAPSEWKVIALSVPGNSFMDTTPVQSNSYFYRVASYNQSGVMNTNRSSAIRFFVRRFEVPKSELIDKNYITENDTKLDIFFESFSSGFTSIKIYNVTGRLVKTILEANIPAGKHFYEWALDNVENKKAARGIYFIHILGPDGLNKIHKVFLVK